MTPRPMKVIVPRIMPIGESYKGCAKEAPQTAVAA